MSHEIRASAAAINRRSFCNPKAGGQTQSVIRKLITAEDGYCIIHKGFWFEP
jgi:hypothetical protein